MTTISDRFRVRRGTAAALALVNEVPLDSEIVVESDTGTVDGKRKFKIGDGVTHWNDLPYFQSGGGGLYFGTEPPTDTTIEWIDINTGTKYTYYDDGDSQQWVELGQPMSSFGIPQVPEGSSFPLGPTTNDKFYRTDLNLLCYFDGTRWLTVHEYRADFTPTNFSSTATLPATTNNYAYCSLPPGQIYITLLYASTRVPGVHNAANYWTFNFRDVLDTVLASFNTSAVDFSVSTYKRLSVNLNAAADTEIIYLQLVKTGSPGGVYPLSSMNYRRVIT